MHGSRGGHERGSGAANDLLTGQTSRWKFAACEVTVHESRDHEGERLFPPWRVCHPSRSFAGTYHLWPLRYGQGCSELDISTLMALHLWLNGTYENKTSNSEHGTSKTDQDQPSPRLEEVEHQRKRTPRDLPILRAVRCKREQGPVRNRRVRRPVHGRRMSMRKIAALEYRSRVVEENF